MFEAQKFLLKIYLLFILVWSLFIGALLFLSSEDEELIELEKEKIEPVKQLHDTTALDEFIYPSGVKGSLRFDWETGEKGKLIEK